jgi:acyl-ACP thioesterase
LHKREIIYLIVLIILSPGVYAAIPARIDLSYATQVKPGGTLNIWVTVTNLNVEYKSIYFDSVVFEDPFVKENISYL